MSPDSTIDIAHIIQLSVAPVFLLAGVGALLNVLAGRLSRIVDRTRTLITQEEKDQHDLDEIHLLKRRAKAINASLAFCTFAATLVCVVIITLFALHFTSTQSPFIIAGLFIATMLSLVIGLILFQIEVYYAIRWLRLSHEN
ncbi:MAG: DUF2721 domain-containing protein [Sinobacterium sp.]|nr:DUF2721 domain-containing protein [Sinobacterium sp.]